VKATHEKRTRENGKVCRRTAARVFCADNIRPGISPLATKTTERSSSSDAWEKTAVDTAVAFYRFRDG
jgi:hypothetical protein